MMKMFAIVFSRDRALQLDATLRSFFLHCQDASQISIMVLYKTSHQKHEHNYQQLIQEYKRYPNLKFIEQLEFRRDLLQLLLPQPRTKIERAEQAILLKYDHHIGSIIARMYKPISNQLVFFLVDDNLFVRDFRLDEILCSIQDNPAAIGFSLRLGQNTTYCYMRDQQQKLPEFSRLANGIQEYNWINSELDFGYPLEVSSSVLRLEDLLPDLIRIPFRHPNTLETGLAKLTPVFRSTRPKLLCYDQSVTFCNPINKTQTGYRNRSGNFDKYSLEILAEEFAAGNRIKVETYTGFVPNSCHQEVDLVFEKQKSISI